jgi:hypothetical protein
LIKINLSELEEEPPKTRHVTFRIPEENYQKLKTYDGNVSNLLRYLVECYLVTKANEERIEKWTKNP